MLDKISLVTISNKYVKYLSQSPEIYSPDADTCDCPRILISDNADKYLTYLLLMVTRLIFFNIVTYPDKHAVFSTIT